MPICCLTSPACSRSWGRPRSCGPLRGHVTVSAGAGDHVAPPGDQAPVPRWTHCVHWPGCCCTRPPRDPAHPSNSFSADSVRRNTKWSPESFVCGDYDKLGPNFPRFLCTIINCFAQPTGIVTVFWQIWLQIILEFLSIQNHKRMLQHHQRPGSLAPAPTGWVLSAPRLHLN